MNRSVLSTWFASFALLVFAPELISGVRRAAAAGDVETVTGVVVSSQSRWARGRTAIVTESVIRDASGREVTVRQLGGRVDGIRMVVLHVEQPILRVGDRVSAEVGTARDLRGRTSRPVRALYAMGAPGGSRAPFVRTEATETRAQLAWQGSCAQLFFDDAGTSHIAGGLEFEEMERVLLRWRSDVQDCSYFDVESRGRIVSEVGLDGRNVVVFREDRWCRPPTDDEPEDCHPAAAAAVTTLNFVDDFDSDRNGAILDADIEFNAVNFQISVDGQTTAPGPGCSDLANTFTHEVGHLMGLDHTCHTGRGMRLVDHEGEPVPDCPQGLDPPLPEALSEATMYAFQSCGETKKASPEADDIAGICAIYPSAEDPNECRAADLNSGGGGCAAGGVPGGGAAGLLALAGLAVTLRRHRRRRV